MTATTSTPRIGRPPVYTEQDAIRLFKEAEAKKGGPITVSDLGGTGGMGLPSIPTVTKMFGSFTKYREAAGGTPAPKGRATGSTRPRRTNRAAKRTTSAPGAFNMSAEELGENISHMEQEQLMRLLKVNELSQQLVRAELQRRADEITALLGA